jgi:hypothetical protein
MSKQNEPAFPVIAQEPPYYIKEGMTLRDWFAGQALAGLLNRQYLTVPVCPKCKTVEDDPGEHYSIIAYSYADAMLLERAK